MCLLRGEDGWGGSGPELESMHGEDAEHQAPTSMMCIGTEVGEERSLESIGLGQLPS